MADGNEALTIDPALRARLEVLATRAGRSVDDLADTVLRAHADEQERLLVELAEDEERWERYLATGQAASLEEVRARLLTLAADAARRSDDP